MANWEIASYVYYNCIKAKNLDYKEKMISENDLIVQLIELIDSLKIKETDISNTLKEEIERFNNFQPLFWNKGKNITINKIQIKEYMKYLLREWSRDEKREVLSYIKSQIYLKDKKVILLYKK